jgi:hypothetical protein
LEQPTSSRHVQAALERAAQLHADLVTANQTVRAMPSHKGGQNMTRRQLILAGASTALAPAGLIEATVRMNVRESIADMIRGGKLLEREVRSGAVLIAGRVEELGTGKISWI